MGAGPTDSRALKSPVRYLAAWFLSFLLLYSLLISPWTGIGEAYATLYRAVMTDVARVLSPYRQVEIARYDENRPQKDTVLRVHLGAMGAHRVTEKRFSTRYYGFISLAFLLALIATTPTNVRHRSRSALIGLAVQSVVVLLTMAATIIVRLPPDPVLWIPAPDSVGLAALKAFRRFTYFSWYVPPLLIWAALMGRRAYAESPLAARGASHSPAAGSKQASMKIKA